MRVSGRNRWRSDGPGLFAVFLAGFGVVAGCGPAPETPRDAAAPPAADGDAEAAQSRPREAAAPETERAAWPLFRGDAQARGVAADTLPDRLEVLWTFSDQGAGFEAGPVIAGGTVYVGSLDGHFYAVDLTTGERRWSFESDLGFTAPAAVRGSRVYVGDVDGRFHCLAAADGELLWDFETAGEIDSGANFHGDRVLVGSQDGRLYCLDALSGELHWSYESDDQIRCFPSVAEANVFLAGCDGRLHVVDVERGERIAEVDLEGPTGSTAAVRGERLFVGTEAGTFFGIDWQAAEAVWRYESPAGAASYRSSAAVTDGAVIVGSRDRLVHALHPEDGAPLWTFATRRNVDASPVVVGERVFVGSADGRFYALALADGEALWEFEAGGGIVGSPAVAEGRLVVTTSRGDVFCFGAP